MNQEPSICTGQFALLYHEIDSVPNSMVTEAGNQSHWDLLLECAGERLLTWRIDSLPERPIRSADLPVGKIGQRIADHRKLYLHYEGRLSQNRGRVSQMSSGRYWACWSSVSCSNYLDLTRNPWQSIEHFQNHRVTNAPPLAKNDGCRDLPLFLWLILSAPSYEARLVLRATDIGELTDVTFCLWPLDFSSG